jgi:thiamine kinase-like enzyme
MGGDPISIDGVLPRIELFRGARTRTSMLSGGLTNRNFLVEADASRYVVRIPGPSTDLLAVDRANERHNAQAAATTGIAPLVREVIPDLDVMVIDFVEGTTMSGDALRTEEQARRMAASMRRLHTAPRFQTDFDMFRIAEGYLGVCEERGIRIPGGFRDRADDVGRIERALTIDPVASVPCHNDLLAENYIDDGRQLWIIDFEYSGNNDPCFELGDTAQECGFDDTLREELCRAYFGSVTPRLRARMELHAIMADVGWTLWAAIQEEISDIDFDFWGWAMERWERAEHAFAGAELPRRLAAAAG